jgi:hypothetical protein
MINTVSLHKVCMAKFVGLLVLAALAVAFFVTPIAMAAVGEGPSADKIPAIKKTIKINFLGKVVPPSLRAIGSTVSTTDSSSSAGSTISTTGSKFPLTLKKTLKPSEVVFGGWFMCGIQDLATNTNYTFMCTVSTFNGTDKVTQRDITGKNIAVVIGLPADPAMITDDVMKKYMGKRGRLLYTLNAGLLGIPAGAEATATGWS